MQEITTTDAYKLAVDTTKNRIYCTMTGNGLPESSDFIQNWKNAVLFVSEGFTVLLDAAQFRITSLKWMMTATKTQEISRNRGLAASAEIVPESVFVVMKLNNIVTDSEVEERRMFMNRNEAEAWLDRFDGHGVYRKICDSH